MRFSIIIPTFQRTQRLRDCLAGLARIDYPRSEFEIIVVDDGSPDPPTDVVHSFEHLLVVRLVVVKPNAGPAKARNAGAAQAVAEYLALLDDDCIPDADWLHCMDDRLRQFPRALVGGAMRNGARHNICAEASQQLVDFLYRYYNSDIDDARWFMSANIVCPREEFLSIGGFGTAFPLAAAEDRDFCDRWREAGYRLIMAPDAVVSHVRPMSLVTFWRQHRTYGRGAHHLHQAREVRNVALPSMEPISFYIRLVFSPFTTRRRWQAPLLLALLIVSQVGYAFGYYPERRRASSPGDGRL
ncbi:MAG: glycosyltransferase [Gemmatimonadaceae bacterium]|nr:glycosyltransferase [Gemmatimonadaceae bacterium]